MKKTNDSLGHPPMTLSDKLQGPTAREHKLRKYKDLLLQSVQTHILPAFIQQGFSIGEPLDRKSADTLPCELQRARPGARGVDLVEIQFMTHQRAAFRINAGIAPKEGMMTASGHWPAEEICIHWLNESFEMYASPGWRSWFSLWFWRLRTPAQSDYDKLALFVTGLLPEIELALREGKLGPHMRRVLIPRRAPALTTQGPGGWPQH